MIELFTHEEVSDVLGGESIGLIHGFIDRVVIDSREAVGGSLFVPLKGERTDGNLFIENALIKGCMCSLVSSLFYMKNQEMINTLSAEYGATFIVVDDGLKALHRLAAYYISRFNDLKIITVTGSSGKTTTKEVLGSILRAFMPTLVTEGNYNSETGLPLTVFRIRNEHRMAVLEMGMNKPGEIKALVDIVNPDISIITNIGVAHIGFFESRDGIAREKKDAFANFTGNNLAIVPGWDDYNEFLKKDVNGRVLSVCDNPDYISEVKNLGFDGWEFLYDGVSVKYPYMGHYNYLNALMAISCVRELGIPAEIIAKGLRDLPLMFGRGEVLNGRNRVIRDCYNANPDSVKNSLTMLMNTFWDGEKIPVIGSMLELGTSSFKEHMKVAEFAGDNFSKVILVGGEYEKVFSEVRQKGNFFFFREVSELKEAVEDLIEPGSLLLLKASRGVRLEDITDYLL